MSQVVDMNNPLVQAVLKALDAKGMLAKPGKAKAKPGKPKLSDEQKAANAKANEAAAEKLFESKGYKNCKARETIKTYDGWLQAGRRVKAKEKGLKIKKGGYALFHLDQTSPVATTH